MSSPTEQRDQALALEHTFTRRLKDLEQEAENRKQASTNKAAHEVGKVEKQYQQRLSELRASRQSAETKEGNAHKKRMAAAKAVHQSELAKIEQQFSEERGWAGVQKSDRIAPIEALMRQEHEGVDEWRRDSVAVAEQEHLEALAKLNEVEPETE